MQNKQTQVAAAVQQLLSNVAGTTFAQVQYVTQVAVAAKHKASVSIVKHVTANVQLFNNVQAFNSVYAAAVKRSAAKQAQNNPANVQAFTAQQNYFAHTQCFSIVQHNTQPDKLYLYAIYNNAKSVYYINNAVATKQQVAQYLTASAAAKLLDSNSSSVYNVANDITHDVQVRTIALANIVSITANKTQVTF